MRKTGNYYGKTFTSNRFGEFDVLICNNIEEATIRFLDTGYKTKVSLTQIDEGNCVDKFAITVMDVGWLGEEPVYDSSGNMLRQHKLWKSLLRRCYDGGANTNHKAYEDCFVSYEFKCYSNFKLWCEKQVGFDQEGWHLDKDILSSGNKVYSSKTCVFVPQEINSFFVKTKNKKTYGDYPTGVTYDLMYERFTAKYSGHGGELHLSYHDNEWSAFLSYKRAKETRAKELAEKWRGQIDERVYKKLINYKVLLTD